MRANITSAMGRAVRRFAILGLGLAAAAVVASCAPRGDAPSAATSQAAEADYLIGPGDSLQIFVWRNPDLSTTVPVRPDGRISIPLVEDIDCAGKTPTQLARDIEQKLKKFVTDPVVTVIVSNFVGPFAQQVRVVGEASEPKAIPYRQSMSALDAMIATGGLTPYAAGNRATLVRTINGRQQSYHLRLGDLLKDGDMSANVPLQPGDVIIIPQSYF
ncbi:MAG TPA: XrtA/PEP-CTERM system exopolysaccharide export protein [Rhizomicrobium sp.]|jgi:polysaccharide export outer membrane protein|nr:XrtA/PEP-CTERM system exopolysaccharide export protein [Rhizomicrobium sp.]